MLYFKKKERSKAEMKTAIIYSSGTGATAECARELYKLIPESEMFNLAVDKCDLTKFDNVILGGGIRAGVAPKPLLRFINQNPIDLQKKNIGIFVCSFDVANANAYIERNFPSVLVKKAVATDGFGSRIDLESTKGFFDRFVIKTAMNNIKKKGEPMPAILKDRINAFAKKFI